MSRSSLHNWKAINLELKYRYPDPNANILSMGLLGVLEWS